MRAILLMTVLAAAALAPRPAAAEECANPHVVVVKKDHSTVEGILRRDLGEKGVLVDQGGRTVFVPEEEIDYVDEDCSRARPAPPRAASPAAPRAEPRETSLRNNFVDMFQRGLRWVGGGCVTLGCGLCSSGIIITLISLVGSLGRGDLLATLFVSGALLGAFGLVSGVFVGTGAGMLFGAQMSDYLKSDPSDASSSGDGF
jgi:hypothetical protein